MPGWDTDAQVLVERVAQVLRAAPADRAEYDQIPAVGRTGRGSAAEEWFWRPAVLQRAKLAVRAASVSCAGAWLGAQQSTMESRKARAVHRLAEALRDVEEERSALEGASIGKEPGAGLVRANSGKVAFIASAAGGLPVPVDSRRPPPLQRCGA